MSVPAGQNFNNSALIPDECNDLFLRREFHKSNVLPLKFCQGLMSDTFRQSPYSGW
jgi:hypothetical protein